MLLCHVSDFSLVARLIICFEIVRCEFHGNGLFLSQLLLAGWLTLSLVALDASRTAIFIIDARAIITLYVILHISRVNYLLLLYLS